MTLARLADYAVTDDAPVLPHDLDAERSVLGAIMVDNEAWSVAAAIVGPEHFYRVAHGQIFRAMTRLSARSAPIDILTVKAELGPELEDAGGYVYVAGLIDGVPRATNVGYYAQIVVDKHRHRAIIAAGYKGNLEQVAAIVNDSTRTASTLHFQSAAEILNEPPIDSVIDGIITADRLNVLVGRRGVGKSQWLALATTAIASGRDLANLNPHSVGAVLYDDREWTLAPWLKAVAAHYRIENPGQLPIVRPRGDLMDLADIASVRRFVARTKDACIRPVITVVDTLPRAADYDENRDGSLIVRACDYIREHLGGAVLLVTHPSESNPDRPRGGNQIEGAADMVVKIAASDGGIVTLTATKNRYGPQDQELARYRRVEVPSVPNGVTLRPASEVLDENALALCPRDLTAREALRTIGGRARHGEWKAAAKEAGLTASQFNTALPRLTAMGVVRQNEKDGRYEFV